MSDLDNAREVLTAYDELVDSLRARVAELEAALKMASKHLHAIDPLRHPAYSMNPATLREIDACLAGNTHANAD